MVAVVVDVVVVAVVVDHLFQVYYKVRQLFFYYKVRQVLLQSATGITKCDDYYGVRQYMPWLLT